MTKQQMMNELQKEMNNNPKFQEIMRRLRKQAKAEGKTFAEWEQIKKAIMENMIYRMMIINEDFRNMVASDISKNIWEKAHGIA